MNNYKFNNTTQDDQVLHFTATRNKNSDEQSHDMISNLRPLQLKAYDNVKNYITNNTTQLVLFLSGEGGTGKSKVIEAVVHFTRKYYGPIIVTAPSCTSSNNINGFTYHSECYFTIAKSK